ncbi:MAG: hypothetical protein AAGF87_00560 [Bacteroidota bacterium]
MARLIILLLLITCYACQEPASTEPTTDEVAVEVSPETDTIPPQFPEDFLGLWNGDLRIWRGKELAMTVPMSLEMAPISDTSYTYTITYGEDDRREYLLIEKDREKGHWYIDEQNGIYLDGYYAGGKFFEGFGVMDTRLMAMLELQGDNLLYEITSGPEGPVRTSGDTIIDGDEIPEVFSYETSSYHRAVLSRE